jgi:hypothetical protein
MKTSLNKWSLSALLIITALLGGGIGWLTYHNATLVKGGMGIVIIIWRSRFGRMMKIDGSFEELLSRSNYPYTFFRDVIITIIYFWAFMSVYELMKTVVYTIWN